MYSVMCDNLPLYIPQMAQTYYLQAPTLTQKANLPDELQFTIPPTHPAYNSINRLVSRIKVYRDGYLISILRPFDSELNMIKTRKWICEGALAWLKDAIVRPFDFSGSPLQALEYFINEYNNQVNANQQFSVGAVTVTDQNDYIARSSIEYLSAYDAIKTRLLDTLGGYLYVTYNGEQPVINWLASAPDTATQAIEFGENLADFRHLIYGGETYTACIPLGKKDESGKRLTIASVNDGKDYIVNTALANTYGYIYAPTKETTWEDVTQAGNLKTKAQTWLTNLGAAVKERIEIKAVDLHNADVNIEAFQFMDNVLVKSTPHNLSAQYILTEIVIPLNDPSATQITLGGERVTLISQLAAAQSSADNIIGTIYADYVTGEQVTAITETTIENSTYITQTVESIISQALQSYTTTNDLETMIQTIQSQITQLADSVTFEFSQTNATIVNNAGNTSQQFESIYSFIRLIASGIVIGESTSDIKLKLENDILYFFTGDETSVTTDNAIAYFAAGKLYVNEAQIKIISIGDSNGMMHFSIVGSGSLQCLFLSPRRVD